MRAWSRYPRSWRLPQQQRRPVAARIDAPLHTTDDDLLPPRVILFSSAVLSFPKKRPPCGLNHPTEHPAFLLHLLKHTNTLTGLFYSNVPIPSTTTTNSKYIVGSSTIIFNQIKSYSYSYSPMYYPDIFPSRVFLILEYPDTISGGNPQDSTHSNFTGISPPSDTGQTGTLAASLLSACVRG